MRFEGGQRVGGDGLRLLTGLTAELLEKVIHQQPDVRTALAQRRHLHADDVQTVKQILPKLARGHGLLQWFVRRRDDAHIHGDRLVAANAFEGARLKDAQNLGLRGQRHVADLIEKDRAAVTLLELADALRGRAGERAPFVAEQFALQQVLRNGRAIDGEEWFPAAAAVVINRAGDQFLAGAAFAGDERRGVRGGELTDQFENILHRLRPPDDAQLVVLGFEHGLVAHDLLHVARGLEGIRDDLLELGDVERLEEIVERPQLHRFDGSLRGAVGGHHDDRHLAVEFAKAAEGFEAVHAAHAHVHDDQVGLHPGEQLQALFAAASGGKFDLRRAENAAEGVLYVRFVVD